MSDRLAIYREGRLWLLDGGAYEPAERFRVNLLYHHFKEKAAESPVLSPLSQIYADQLGEALKQYDEANSGHSENAK